MTHYEEDFYAWTKEQAALIRSLKVPGLDWENVAEEIESTGRDFKRRSLGRLCSLLMELLLFKYLLPDDDGKRRGNTWIRIDRSDLLCYIEESPSLIDALEKNLEECYAHSVIMAGSQHWSLVIEDFPRKCPFSLEQILDENFFPE